MTIRVQLKMQWHISLAPAGAFSKLEDFETHARNVLEGQFSHYDPKVVFEVLEDYGPELKIIGIKWDVNLDGVPGGLYDPQDHQAHAKVSLVDRMRMWGSRLDVEIMRHTDERDDTADELVPWESDYRENSYNAMLAKFAAEDAAA